MSEWKDAAQKCLDVLAMSGKYDDNTAAALRKGMVGVISAELAILDAIGRQKQTVWVTAEDGTPVNATNALVLEVCSDTCKGEKVWYLRAVQHYSEDACAWTRLTADHPRRDRAEYVQCEIAKLLLAEVPIDLPNMGRVVYLVSLWETALD